MTNERQIFNQPLENSATHSKSPSYSDHVCVADVVRNLEWYVAFPKGWSS